MSFKNMQIGDEVRFNYDWYHEDTSRVCRGVVVFISKQIGSAVLVSSPDLEDGEGHDGNGVYGWVNEGDEDRHDLYWVSSEQYLSHFPVIKKSIETFF